MMASGHAEEAVARLSESSEAQAAGERGTFEVSFGADDLGLPDGGWVQLEIVGGGADYDKTAEASPDGKVRFMVPKQDKGSIITVTLTMYLPDGTPYCTGSKTGPAEDGATFIIPLEDLPSVIITFGGNGARNGKTAEQGGESYEVMEYTGTSLSMAVASTIAGATLEVTVNGSPASTSGTLSDGFNDISAVATMGGGKPPVTATRRVYVVKKLVKPVITMSGATANGETVASGGKSYQIIEYTGTNPTVTITNSYDGSSASYEAKLGTTVLSTASPSTITQDLSDGFNAVTATLSEPYCDTLKDEKYYYVVKKLSEDDVSIAFDNIDGSVALAADGYEVLHYSYLAASPTLPKVSGIGNEYMGDATTPELGSSYLEITFTGDTTVEKTDSLPSEGQELNRGDCIITVYLRKPKCTPVSVERKVRVKIKPVTVSMSSITLDYDTKDFHRWVTQSSYVQASNADGTDSTQKTVYAMNHVRYGADGWTPVKTVSVSAVLTAPDSSFRFWTTNGSFSYDDNPGETPTSVGSYNKTWTLDDFRVTANRSVDQYVGVSKAASRYTFTLTVTD